MSTATTESRIKDLDTVYGTLRKSLDALEKRVTTSMDHIATELGKLETQAKSTSDVLEQTTDKITGLGERVAEHGHSTELIHNKIELLENRFAGVEKNLAGQRIVVEDICAQLEDSAPPPPLPNAELYTALVAAQLEIRNADANVDNEFTHKKYANLASVMDAVRGPLAKNGLAIIQLTDDPGDGMLGIRTMLVHTSGQVIEDHITMAPEKFTPQGVGSCRTYMRRYAVLAICGIAGALDDDAEGTKKGTDEYERISSQEAEAIIVKADELFGERADAAMAKMLNRLFGGIERVSDIKAGEADVAVTSLTNAAELMAKTAAKKDEMAEKLATKEKADKRKADEQS